MNKLIIIALSGFVLIQCSIDQPFLPAWDTHVQVNFRPEKFVVRDMLKTDALHDSLNTQLGDTLLYYAINDSLDPQKVDASELSISSVSDRIVKQVGVIHVDAPAPASTPSLGLADLFPMLNITVGAVLPPIPDQTLEAKQQSVSFDNYLEVDIDSAKTHLVFHNNLIFDIRPGMQITLYDSSRYNDPDSGRIGVLTFPDSILSGSSATSKELDLAGQVLSNGFYIKYKIPIKGTTSPRTLTQDDVNSSFYIDVYLSAIQVSRAVAEIPEQRVEENLSASVDTKGKSVKRAHISSGNVVLTIDNHLNVGAALQITILNLQDDQNNPYVINLDMNENASSTVTANLAGYTLQNHLNNGSPVSELAYQVVATTHPSNGYAQVQSTDSIVVDVSSSNIMIDRFEGDVGTIDLSFDPVIQDNLINTSDFNAKFKLPDVVFTMVFYNQFNLDIDLNLTITGYHKDNASGIITDSVKVNISSRLNRGSSSHAGKTTLVLSGSDPSPNIVDLMSVLPTSIKVTGSGQVSGDGSLSANDEIRVKYNIESPLSIQIDTPINITSNVAELTSADIDSETQNMITNDLSTVLLRLNSENGLPVAADVLFSISSDSTLLFADEASSGGKVITRKIALSAAATDANGLVSSAAADAIKLELTRDQLQLFNSLPLFYKSKIVIDSSPDKVLLRSRDKITVSGNIDISFRVNQNGL